MKYKGFSLLSIALLFLLSSTAAARNLTEFYSADDAEAAGWARNNGGIISVSEGAGGNSPALRVTGAREYGGMTWRPADLTLPDDAVITFCMRQNLHPEWNFYFQLDIVQEDGSARTVSRVLPGGAGWQEWQEVTVDFKGEKPGRISRLSYYTDAFADTTDIFLEIDQLKITAPGGAGAVKDPLNVYTIPFTDTPPVTDGVLSDGEYAEAGGMTGFSQGEDKYSARQTHIWYSHDKENLYIAFSTIYESQGAPELGKAGIITEAVDVLTGDIFELWIATAETHLQYVVNLNQGMYSYDHARNCHADNTAVFKGTYTANAFQAGGKWYGEFVIPKKNIPGWAENLSLLFCRDFYPADGRRTPDDWTSARPMHSIFSEKSIYPEARFSPAPCSIIVSKFGDWLSGETSVSGKISGFSSPLDLSLQIFDKSGTPVKNFTQKATDGNFTIGGVLQLTNQLDGIAVFKITDSLSGEVLHAQDVPFSCGSPLRFRCTPLITESAVILTFDTHSIAPLPEGACAYFTFSDEGKTVAEYTTPLEQEPQAYEILYPVENVEYKAFRIDCSIVCDGQLLLSASVPEVWLGDPPWQVDRDKKYGIPEPWTPIVRNDSKLDILERSYIISSSGLPSGITASGKEIFSTPPELRLTADGRVQNITFLPPEIISESGERIVYAIYGESECAVIEGRLAVDYDGFARWQIALHPKFDLTVNALEAAWSMPEERALYARANRIDGLAAGYMANLDTDGPQTIVTAANAVHSNCGWPWESDFFYNFMIGDDDTGFSFMTVSDQYHKGGRHYSIKDGNGTKDVTLTLTSDHPLRAGEIIFFDYAWSGLPMKTPSSDPLDYHHGLVATNKNDVPLLEVEEDFFKLCPLVVGAWYTEHESHWQLQDTDPAKRTPNVQDMDPSNYLDGIKRVHDLGSRIITEGIFLCAMNTILDETKRHQEEWIMLPSGYSWPNNRGAMNLAACVNSSWSDYIETVCRRIYDDTPLDGVYMDVATEAPCSNTLHGCGYIDEEGNLKPTVNLWGLRELHKRIYTYYHTGGRQGRSYHHYLNNAAWAGFTEGGFSGEDWCLHPDFSRMTPDFFRAAKMTQYGSAFSFFAMFLYWQCGSLPEVMAICLPHKVYPAVWAYRKDNYPEIKPYWAIMDQWLCSSEFIPYWAAEPPADISYKDNILISAYKKPDRTLLTVANWQYDTADVQFTISPTALNGKAVSAKELLSGREISLSEGSTISVSIPQRNILLIELVTE